MCASKLSEIRSKLRDEIHSELKKTLPNEDLTSGLTGIRHRLQGAIRTEVNSTVDERIPPSEVNATPTPTLGGASRSSGRGAIQSQNDKLSDSTPSMGQMAEVTKVAPRANCKALCIGMNKYPEAPLTNATSDAQDMAAAMTHLGYEVTSIFDRGTIETRNYLNRFLGTINEGDDVVLTFAGHGASFNSEPYFFPIDAESRHGAINLYSEFIDHLKNTGARSAIVVIDACRNQMRVNLSDALDDSEADMELDDWFNELIDASSQAPKSARGMSSAADFGFAILFSTSHDATASDAPEIKNGLFTYFFKNEVLKPNLSLREIFENVRIKVRNASEGEQTPALYDGLSDKFYFYPR